MYRFDVLIYVPIRCTGLQKAVRPGGFFVALHLAYAPYSDLPFHANPFPYMNHRSPADLPIA